MPVPLLAISRTEIDQITLFELDDPERELATIPVTSSQPFGLAFDETRRWLYSACETKSFTCPSAAPMTAAAPEHAFPAAASQICEKKSADFVPLRHRLAPTN